VKMVRSFITDATDAKQRPLPHRELHETGEAPPGGYIEPRQKRQTTVTS
jgi:hypothetical protein